MKRILTSVLAAFALHGALAGENSGSMFAPDQYHNMVADQKAYRVGDALTVLIQEAAVASSSVDAKANRKLDLELRGQVVGKAQHGVTAGITSSNDGGGEVARSGRVTAQITVTVQSIAPNGELLLGGEQVVDLNGEKQIISVSGRVRPRDISDNSVLSSRIADAQIAYTGQGYMADKSRPKWFSQFLNLIGL